MALLETIFPSTLAAWLFFAVCVFWLVSEFVVWKVNESRRRGITLEHQQADKGSEQLISINALINGVVVVLFAVSDITPLPSWVFFLGIGLLIIGIVLRVWSEAVLGRYFTGTVGVQDGQVVVNWGPYRFVRHPSYSGSLLEVLGLAFISQTWGAVVVLMPYFAVVYSYRIRVEEELLTSKLGDKYVMYSKRTKRLIPYIL